MSLIVRLDDDSLGSDVALGFVDLRGRLLQLDSCILCTVPPDSLDVATSSLCGIV